MCSTTGYNSALQFCIFVNPVTEIYDKRILYGSFPSILHELRIVVCRGGKLELKLDQVIVLPK